jgi:hypothetical protein
MRYPVRSAFWAFLLVAGASLACSLLTPAAAVPTLVASPRAVPSTQPSAPASAAPKVSSAAPPSASPAATVTFAGTALPQTLDTPTAAPLQLELVQSQVWSDSDGNVRANLLLRNPYKFPVAPTFRASAILYNSAGKLIRNGDLLLLDGITGGTGFLLPGETIAANACFTCESIPLPELWASIKFNAAMADATGRWKYSTDVAASNVKVSFSGNSPIFDVTGTVKNSGTLALSRVALRVNVFGPQGQLVGAAEASADNVGPGASASIRGYGIGQATPGTLKYDISALGVIY